MSALLLLSACGPDLAELETTERALAREVETLGGTVVELRTRMQEMGLAPKGPVAHPEGSNANDLASQIPVKVSRAGDVPTFEALPAPERRANTDCGYRLATAWLEALSDPNLEQVGVGRASPLQLFHDGRPLAPHAPPAAYEKECRFSFRHGPKFTFVSPDKSVDAVSGTWTMSLAPDVPLARGGDGRPMYWVYPGTSLTFELGAGWNDADWGPLSVALDARVLYVGTPDQPRAQPSAPAVVSFLGFEQSGRDPVWALTHEPDPPDGPWELEVASPPGGPFVVLDRLTLGNDAHGLTLTGPAEAE